MLSRFDTQLRQGLTFIHLFIHPPIHQASIYGCSGPVWGAGVPMVNKMDQGHCSPAELSAWWEIRGNTGTNKNTSSKCPEAKKQGFWHRMTVGSYAGKELRHD